MFFGKEILLRGCPPPSLLKKVRGLADRDSRSFAIPPTFVLWGFPIARSDWNDTGGFTYRISSGKQFDELLSGSIMERAPLGHKGRDYLYYTT